MSDPIDYVEIGEGAAQDIRDAGQGMVLLRPAGVSDDYDPVTGTDPTPDVDEPYPFYGLTLAPTFGYVARVGSGNVQMRDQLVYMEAGIITPSTSDLIYILGEEWTIVRYEPVAPAGIPVIHILHIRP